MSDSTRWIIGDQLTVENMNSKGPDVVNTKENKVSGGPGILVSKLDGGTMIELDANSLNGSRFGEWEGIVLDRFYGDNFFDPNGPIGAGSYYNIQQIKRDANGFPYTNDNFPIVYARNYRDDDCNFFGGGIQDAVGYGTSGAVTIDGINYQIVRVFPFLKPNGEGYGYQFTYEPRKVFPVQSPPLGTQEYAGIGGTELIVSGGSLTTATGPIGNRYIFSPTILGSRTTIHPSETFLNISLGPDNFNLAILGGYLGEYKDLTTAVGDCSTYDTTYWDQDYDATSYQGALYGVAERMCIDSTTDTTKVKISLIGRDLLYDSLGQLFTISAEGEVSSASFNMLVPSGDNTWITVTSDTTGYTIKHIGPGDGAVNVTFDTSSACSSSFKILTFDTHGHFIGSGDQTICIGTGVYSGDNTWISVASSTAGGGTIDHIGPSTTSSNAVEFATVSGGTVETCNKITFDSKGHYNGTCSTINIPVNAYTGDNTWISIDTNYIINHIGPSSNISSTLSFVTSTGTNSLTLDSHGHVNVGTNTTIDLGISFPPGDNTWIQLTTGTSPEYKHIGPNTSSIEAVSPIAVATSGTKIVVNPISYDTKGHMWVDTGDIFYIGLDGDNTWISVATDTTGFTINHIGPDTSGVDSVSPIGVDTTVCKIGVQPISYDNHGHIFVETGDGFHVALNGDHTWITTACDTNGFTFSHIGPDTSSVEAVSPVGMASTGTKIVVNPISYDSRGHIFIASSDSFYISIDGDDTWITSAADSSGFTISHIGPSSGTTVVDTISLETGGVGINFSGLTFDDKGHLSDSGSNTGSIDIVGDSTWINSGQTLLGTSPYHGQIELNHIGPSTVSDTSLSVDPIGSLSFSGGVLSISGISQKFDNRGHANGGAQSNSPHTTSLFTVATANVITNIGWDSGSNAIVWTAENVTILSAVTASGGSIPFADCTSS